MSASSKCRFQKIFRKGSSNFLRNSDNYTHFLFRFNSKFCHFLSKEIVRQHRSEGQQCYTTTKSWEKRKLLRIGSPHSRRAITFLQYSYTLNNFVFQKKATCKLRNNAKKAHFEESWPSNTIISRVLMSHTVWGYLQWNRIILVKSLLCKSMSPCPR